MPRGRRASLRALWRWLEKQPEGVKLAREERRDLFLPEPVTVLAAEVPNPAAQAQLFKRVSQAFPALTYYDADLQLSLRYRRRARAPTRWRAAGWRRMTMARVRAIEALDSPWELDPEPAPLRVLYMEPDCDPNHSVPHALCLRYEKHEYRLPFEPVRPLLINLRALLARYDPDLILSRWGDTWLLPHLLGAGRAARLHPAAQPRGGPRRRLIKKEHTYFSYGQIIYRGKQMHLFGRCHIDQRNAMLWGDYGLEGTLESARVTCLPLQVAARVSPGTGISSMEIAHRAAHGDPGAVAQAAGRKAQDRAGPDPRRPGRDGLPAHRRAARQRGHGGFRLDVPQHHGALQHLARGARRPPSWAFPTIPRAGAADAGAAAEKAHRAQAARAQPAALGPAPRVRQGPLAGLQVAAGDLLRLPGLQERALRADRIARGGDHLGARGAARAPRKPPRIWASPCCTCTWMGCGCRRRAASQPADFNDLLVEISARTHLPVGLDGVYRWVAFLASRVDARVAVPNRYFGVFQDGSLKVRGIDVRRHDTPVFIGDTQMAILECFAGAADAASLHGAGAAGGGDSAQAAEEAEGGHGAPGGPAGDPAAQPRDRAV